MIADASLLDILAADAALRLRVAKIRLAGTMPDDPIWPRGDGSRVCRGGDWSCQASCACLA